MAAIFFVVGVLPLLISVVGLGLAIGRPESVLGAGTGVLIFELIPLTLTGVIAAFTSIRTTSQRRWALQSGLFGGGLSIAFAIVSGTLAAFFGSDLLALLAIGVLAGGGAALAALAIGSGRPRPAPDMIADF